MVDNEAMNLIKSDINGFGKAYTLLNRSCIALNEKGHIEYINDYALTSLGIARDELFIGKPLVQFCQEHQLPWVIDKNGNLNKSSLLNTNNQYRKWDRLSINVDNEHWWFLTDEDVTEREKVNRVLEEESFNITGHPFDPKISIDQYIREIQFYLTNIIHNIPCYIYWKNKNLQYVGCNEMAAHFVRFNSTQEIIGKTDYDLFSDKLLAESYRKADQQILDNGLAILNEPGELKDPSGEHFFTLVSKVPLKNILGDVIGILGITVNITAQKEAEEREKNALSAATRAEASELLAKIKAEKEEEMRKTVMILVGDIVHDLRTPIATIRTAGGLLSNLLPGLLDVYEEARELGAKKITMLNKKKLECLIDNSLIDALHNAVLMMDDFINTSLLELANAQKSQQSELTREDLTKCSSRRILENTLDAYALGENIKINQNIAYDFFLMGNSILIMRILFNLISNSIDQINLNGAGEITITTEEAGNWNLLKIKDTGGGAAPEVVSQMFNGYFTTKKNGTGIGLAFGKKMMQNFGGDLTCQGVYGDYIEFILSFPKILDE